MKNLKKLMAGFLILSLLSGFVSFVASGNDVSSTNLALNKKAYVLDGNIYSNVDPAVAIDGDWNNKLQASGNWTLVVDMLEEFTINKVVFKIGQSMLDYEILGSLDNVTYTTLVPRKKDIGINYALTTNYSFDTNTRYVKLKVYASDVTYGHIIYDFQVFRDVKPTPAKAELSLAQNILWAGDKTVATPYLKDAKNVAIPALETERQIKTSDPLATVTYDNNIYYVSIPETFTDKKEIEIWVVYTIDGKVTESAHQIIYAGKYPKNIAVGKIATMNAPYGWGHIADHAIDGNFSETYAQTIDNVLWSLNVYLKKTYTISKITYKPESGSYAKSYDIYITTDLLNWTKVATNANATYSNWSYDFTIPVVAKAVRVTHTSVDTSKSYGCSIREFEIYAETTYPTEAEEIPALPINIAKNKAAMMSAVSFPDTDADKAVDGDLNTAAEEDTSKNAKRNYDLIVDLGTSREFEQVNLFIGSNNGLLYDLYYSDDMNNWTKIVLKNNGYMTTNSSYNFIDNHIKAQYVKLSVRPTQTTHFTIKEIEILGPPKKFNVEFDANGGEKLGDIPLVQNGLYEDSIVPVPQVKQDGYQLIGWYTEIGGGTKVTVPFKANADTKVYARWAKGAGYKNIARSKKSFISTAVQSGYEATKAIDGNYDTAVKILPPANESTPSNFIIDLRAKCYSGRFVLTTSGVDSMVYSIFVSSDGVNYTEMIPDLTTIGNDILVEYDETLFRFFKFSITEATLSADSTAIMISELEIWGIPNNNYEDISSSVSTSSNANTSSQNTSSGSSSSSVSSDTSSQNSNSGSSVSSVSSDAGESSASAVSSDNSNISDDSSSSTSSSPDTQMPKNRLFNTSAKIYITGTDNFIEGDKLEVVIVKDKIKLKKTTDLLETNGSIIGFYDISVTNNGKSLDRKDFYTVQIMIPAKLKKEPLAVYYVDSDLKTKTDMKAKIVGNFIQFETNHFSNYVFINQNERVIIVNTFSRVAQIIMFISLGIFILLFLLQLAVIFLKKSKRSPA